MRLPRVMLAAPASGSGKTLITCGLLRALVNQKKKVMSFKCGPDYIDPMFHTKVIGTPSRNLDTFFTGAEMTRYLFARQAAEAELSVMEGVMGYYDGVAGVTTQASSYDLADVTDTPVILVVNTRGMSLSVIPFIRGFLDYRQDSHIKGIILNQTSASMYPQLKERIESELPVRVYGFVPTVSDCVIESRHLGLVTPREISDLRQRLGTLASVLEETLDLEGILALADEAPEISGEMPGDLASLLEQNQGGRNIRIGVARDAAFCFYYEDNLELLQRLGAQIVPFSPISDNRLPENLSGLIFGGGYPELYAEKLSKNKRMLSAIREAISGGMPYLAECGGFMYLHESMEDMEGNAWPMAGIIKARAYRTKKLGRFGYIELEANQNQVFGAAGSRIRGHEFHYFDSTGNGDAFHAKKPHRKKHWDCIVADGRCAAGFPHLYYYANPQFAANFVGACRRYPDTEALSEAALKEGVLQCPRVGMTLQETVNKIAPPDERAMEAGWKHWDSIAKPLRSLGKLERALVQIAGIQGTPDIRIDKKGLVIMCADNGVVEEGVTQSGQDVTAIVAENFLDEKSCVAIMCKKTGTDIFPVDIGMAADTPRVEKRKIAYGTKNMVKEPAMTRQQAIAAIEAGIAKVCELKEKGFQILATGEMGIGNTTTSSAMTAVYLNVSAAVVTGRGAGLSTEGLNRKIAAIDKAIALHHPNPDDPVDVLAKVGGFDIAGLTGVFLGGAANGIPVVADGFISAVAALTAVKIAPACAPYILASHVSKEPAAQMLLDALGKEAFLTCDMCLGEGTGAVALFPLLDLASEIYHKMSTFDEVEFETYVPLV